MRALFLLLLLTGRLLALTALSNGDAAKADGEYSYPALRAGNSYIFSLSGSFGGGTAIVGYINPTGAFTTLGQSFTAAGSIVLTLPEYAAASGRPAISLSGATTPALVLTITGTGVGGGAAFTDLHVGGDLLLGGDMRLVDTVWDDLRITSGGFELTGNADPSQVDWQPGGSGATLKMWEFAKDDQVFVAAQMSHAYKPGTNLQMHLHWCPRQYGTAQRGNKVGWKLDVTAAQYSQAFPATVTLDLSHAVPADATDHQHLITSSASFTVPATFKESGMILMRVYRSDTGVDDTWSETLTGRLPLLMEVDIHYQIDKLGSDNEIPD